MYCGIWPRICHKLWCEDLGVYRDYSINTLIRTIYYSSTIVEGTSYNSSEVQYHLHRLAGTLFSIFYFLATIST
jgi:hypothetical protein